MRGGSCRYLASGTAKAAKAIIERRVPLITFSCSQSVCFTYADRMTPSGNTAFGAPGIEPRWTRSSKEGIGTAYHTSCRIWFTLSHGIVNEIYYPTVDQPNTRDFQFLISDGETFC